MKGFWSPSSSGLGLRPFTAATGVRLPLGTPSFYARFFYIPGKSTPRKINYFSFSIIRIKIFTILSTLTYGDVAQLVERNAGSVEVRGSTPLVSTTPLVSLTSRRCSIS